MAMSTLPWREAVKVIEAVYDAPDHRACPDGAAQMPPRHRARRPGRCLGRHAERDLALTFAAEASGVKPENVYIHNTFSGGGFGRRLRPDGGRAGGVGVEGGRQTREIAVEP